MEYSIFVEYRLKYIRTIFMAVLPLMMIAISILIWIMIIKMKCRWRREQASTPVVFNSPQDYESNKVSIVLDQSMISLREA